MKMFGFSLSGQAITAVGIGAALMLSVAAGHAQSSGPFAGFDGAWTGTGTVTLSDGQSEHIRCKAEYKVNPNGLNLKQKLDCASDSYKFLQTRPRRAVEGIDVNARKCSRRGGGRDRSRVI